MSDLSRESVGFFLLSYKLNSPDCSILCGAPVSYLLV